VSRFYLPFEVKTVCALMFKTYFRNRIVLMIKYIYIFIILIIKNRSTSFIWHLQFNRRKV